MTKKDILIWKQGFEAAREVERQLTRREPLDSERSVRLALALIQICRKQGAWPAFKRDKIWDDEVSRVREQWVRLRKAMVVNARSR